MTATKVSNHNGKDIFEQIDKIVLLKIKALIVKNLKKRDIPEFESVIRDGDIGALFDFAQAKIPNFSAKIYKEMKQFGQKVDK